MKIKLKILEEAKKIVRTDGWSEQILNNISKSDIKYKDLLLYFPNGYKELLILALNELNEKHEEKVRKKNIINFPLSLRIKKILMLRFDILEKDKNFYQKTFNHLLLPQNYKLMKKNLYKTTDNMWYLAGDNSTDFSFYTKRFTLIAIYVNALFVFYNNDYKKTEINIDKNLKKISKIPKIKKNLSFMKDNLPILLKGLFN